MSKSLVLVVGAGASKEVGLPIGAELRSKIAEALNIQYEYGRTQVSGSKHIDNAFRVLVEDLNPPSSTSILTSNLLGESETQCPKRSRSTIS